MNLEKQKPENKTQKQGWVQKLLAWLANGAEKAGKDKASCST
ncbi:Uncharacterized protein dnl_37010 [Desulfonema limicola]|uniref:Uncharacterized protein n=1 Tax=Desulfonema limicola TaxID=45656 RepID=A0A975B9Q5_9BACT|nr:hypothetical protein [Desulfonema limicola]QTA81368.1 Uncharacterized protein dnl_37010 [Desulfonema limicola]